MGHERGGLSGNLPWSSGGPVTSGPHQSRAASAARATPRPPSVTGQAWSPRAGDLPPKVLSAAPTLEPQRPSTPATALGHGVPKPPGPPRSLPSGHHLDTGPVGAPAPNSWEAPNCLKAL